jgi:hypothetical protein
MCMQFENKDSWLETTFIAINFSHFTFLKS